MKYSFIAFTPRLTLTLSDSTGKNQIDLFKNYLYSIGLCTPPKKQLHNKCKYEYD